MDWGCSLFSFPRFCRVFLDRHRGDIEIGVLKNFRFSRFWNGCICIFLEIGRFRFNRRRDFVVRSLR